MQLENCFFSQYSEERDNQLKFPHFAQDSQVEFVQADEVAFANIGWVSARPYSREKGVVSTAREVDASLVDLPNSAQAIPLSDYLPKKFNDAFNNPDVNPAEFEDVDEPLFSGSQVPASNSKPAPFGFMASDSQQWRHLLRRAARAGVIRLATDFADPRLSAGGFCVDNFFGRLRLICDRRVRNWREYLLGKARLPKPQRLCRMLLPGSHVIRTSGRDLKDLYFILRTDPERWSRQSWGARGPLHGLKNWTTRAWISQRLKMRDSGGGLTWNQFV